MASVREALGKFTLAPTIDFDTNGSIDIPVAQQMTAGRPQVTHDPTYNPFHTRNTIYPDRAPKNWESLYEGIQNTEYRVQTELPTSRPTEPIISVADTAPIWQYGGKYILMPTEGGLLFVHQHRAHVAVLYAQFVEQLNHAQGAMQQLLFPEVMVMTQDEMVLVQTLLPD